MHDSRLCYVTIDCDDLGRAVAFWCGALHGVEEPIVGESRAVYRRLKLPHSELRLLVQRVPERKVRKSRVHLDIETDDVEAEVTRLEQLGARRYRLRTDRGFRFWVMLDPFENEFCVIQTEFEDLLARDGSRWP